MRPGRNYWNGAELDAAREETERAKRDEEAHRKTISGNCKESRHRPAKVKRLSVAAPCVMSTEWKSW